MKSKTLAFFLLCSLPIFTQGMDKKAEKLNGLIVAVNTGGTLPENWKPILEENLRLETKTPFIINLNSSIMEAAEIIKIPTRGHNIRREETKRREERKNEALQRSQSLRTMSGAYSKIISRHLKISQKIVATGDISY